VTVFVDTSALYALFDRDDHGHSGAAAAWNELASGDHTLVTTNYVLLETVALLQRRLGLAAVHDLDDHIVPLLTTRWVAEALHHRALARLRRTDRREVSLVDCASFVLMEAEGIREAFALDDDFAAAGFRVLPRPAG
jgi:predicted nucleic acid-binding protein